LPTPEQLTKVFLREMALWSQTPMTHGVSLDLPENSADKGTASKYLAFAILVLIAMAIWAFSIKVLTNEVLR
jgi:hypothetical protein